MPYLEISNVTASYGAKPVLMGVTLTLERSQIVSLIGPSGSGKSTLLRVLLGLTPLSGGSITLEGRQVDYQSRRAVKEVRGRFAIVFQQYNLFGNMTALRNVTIGPIKVRRGVRENCEQEARALLERVGLGRSLDAYPDTLSGGQQQRVALARALALKPDVLLLDEVTSALDPELVGEVLDVVRMLAADGMTMLIVSHEMGFVREISSKVVFMADGRDVEVGSPERIFESPTADRTRAFVSRIIRH